jgi:hypothetical protein
MRYAILATTGNPFTFRYWLRHYDKTIAPHIDKLYVGQSGPTNPEYLDIIEQLCKERNIDFDTTQTNEFHWGPSFQKAYSMLPPAQEDDVLLLLESDIYVFDKGITNKYLSEIEQGKYRLIGTRRNSCHNIDLNDPQTKTEEMIWFDGLWPCYMFCRYIDFDNTYKEMKSFLIEGAPLGHNEFHNVRGNEEFSAFAYLLQKDIYPHERLNIPVHRGNHDNILSKGGSANWIHFGVIEQLVLPKGVFRDENNIPILVSPNKDYQQTRPLADRPSSQVDPVILGMCQACVKTSSDTPGLRKWQQAHLDAIERAVQAFNYDRTKINYYSNILSEWVKDLP